MPSHAWLRSKGIDPRLHNAWTRMRSRCNTTTDKDYARYGGRGIKVDPRWDSYVNFAADMGPHPGNGQTLDREKNDLGYSKDNCRWASRLVQGRNRGAYHSCDMARAQQIREFYSTGFFTQASLADHFGITQSHVSKIVRGELWAA